MNIKRSLATALTIGMLFALVGCSGETFDDA